MNAIKTTATVSIAIAVAAATLLGIRAYTSDSQQTPPERGEPTVPTATTSASLASVNFNVEGMSCMSCVASIKNAVQAIDGVRNTEVDLAERRARIEYVEGKVSPEQIAQAITKLGYIVLPLGIGTDGAPAASSDSQPPMVVTVSIPIEGMSCASCTASVKRAVTALEGVRAADVDLAAQLARIEYAQDKTTPEQIAEAIARLGFKPGVPVVDGDK